jgi:YbgC/YbaW family acyl-CoA thioester hydrolase
MDTAASWNHRTKLRVRGYELDSYRHVNHAVYLSYLEQARWEYLSACGLSLSELDRMKRWPVVVHLEMDYKKPALMDDELEIFSRVSKLGRASMEIEHEIRCNGSLILSGKVVAAIIDETGKATRVPEQFERMTTLS